MNLGHASGWTLWMMIIMRQLTEYRQRKFILIRTRSVHFHQFFRSKPAPAGAQIQHNNIYALIVNN